MPPPAVPLYVATLMESVARLEGKVDTFINQMAAQDNRTTVLVAEFGKSFSGLELRTRKVENRQHWYAGVAAAIGAVAGAAIDLISGHQA
jgi:hypothetical protein